MTQPVQIEFDFDTPRTVEFGFGYDTEEGSAAFALVPVGETVQTELRTIIDTTVNNRVDLVADPSEYEPANRYAETDYFYLDIEREEAQLFKRIIKQENLTPTTSFLDELRKMYFYFARLTDHRGQKLIAMRRPNQFKGQLKKQNRLLRLIDDSLELVDDPIFTLNDDFDILVDHRNVHVFRPRGFDLIAQTQEIVMASVKTNIDQIQTDIPFVDFEGIAQYATTHVWAARLVSSIHTAGFAEGVDKNLLLDLCKGTGVNVKEVGGDLVIGEGHEVAFLEVLDRRRYEIALTGEGSERYRALNRQSLSN